MKKLAIAVALSAACTAPAFAESQHQIGFGWLHVNPQEKSDALKTTPAVGPGAGIPITSPGTSSSLSNENTLGITYTYIADDHVSMQLVGGVPPKFELSGHGTSGALGPLDGKLATVRQWSPTALGIYTFGAPSQKLRPYVGIGVTYTKFSDIKLDDGFVASVKARGSAMTGGLVPASAISVKAEADDAIDPTVVLGLDYQINKNWYAQLSASYLPLETTATIYIDSPAGSLAKAEAKMDINPVVGYLGIAYRF